MTDQDICKAVGVQLMDLVNGEHAVATMGHAQPDGSYEFMLTVLLPEDKVTFIDRREARQLFVNLRMGD